MRNPKTTLPGFPRPGPLTTTAELKQYEEGDPGSIQCLLCGHLFKTLAHHLDAIHRTSPDDYRERYGLKWSRGLACKETLDRHGAHTDDLVAAGVLGPRYPKGTVLTTPVIRPPRRKLGAAVRAAIIEAAKGSKPRTNHPTPTNARERRNARRRELHAFKRAARLGVLP